MIRLRPAAKGQLEVLAGDTVLGAVKEFTVLVGTGWPSKRWVPHCDTCKEALTNRSSTPMGAAKALERHHADEHEKVVDR